MAIRYADGGRPQFVRAAIEDACHALAADTTLDEAHRDLAVDSDTQGVAGHPPIVETILKKIDAARVFVADLTLVATCLDGGRAPNPNVLIEYGWALKSLSHERIICLMNTAYGRPSNEALPFDLRHLRWPICYELREDSTAEAKAEQKKRLTRLLTDAIRLCVEAAPEAAVAPLRVPFAEFREWVVTAGWCADIHTAIVGDNDWLTFVRRLRQAAVDGEIAFSGRRYIHDYGQASDDQPFVDIPRAHFDEFGFDLIQLAQAANYDIFTGKTGEAPSALKGQIFRDLHIDAKQARDWLDGAGRPPPAADIAVGVNTAGAQVGDFHPLCSLAVRNIGDRDFDGCLVEMVEISRPVPDGMPMPLALRTASQIRAGERGRFTLSAGQEVLIPLVFNRSTRRNEWFIFDENGGKHFFSPNPTKMLLRIYGGNAPGTACVFVDTDAGWNALPSVQTVPADFTLNPKDAPKSQRAKSALDFFAPELTRIFRRQVAVLNRVVPNFISASAKHPQPGDTWASLKPSRPQLYPSAPKFHELPAADATALIKFYDSLQEVSDMLEGYKESAIADVNHWNVLMHHVVHNLTLGGDAIRRFCPDTEFNPHSPAGGSLLHQAERARSLAQSALSAHLKRYGVS